MKRNKKKEKRSIFTTVTSSIIGLAILFVSILTLPISNITEGLTLGIGVLLVILCVIVAIDGKKGTVKELVYMLTFWR